MLEVALLQEVQLGNGWQPTILRVHSVPDATMQIFFKTLTNATVTLQVHRIDTIQHVKELIEECEGEGLLMP